LLKLTRLPSLPAIWFRVLACHRTRCCLVATSPTRMPSATASARISSSCRSTVRLWTSTATISKATCGTNTPVIDVPTCQTRSAISWSDEEGIVDESWENDGELVRQAYTLREDDGDVNQAGTLVRDVMDDAQRDELVETVAGSLETVIEPVLSNAFQYWKNIDEDIGQRIEKAARSVTAQTDQQPGGDPL